MSLLKEHNVFLLQGSNKENRKKYLDESLFLISKKIGKIIQKSSYFESEPWSMNKDTYPFYNRALHVKTFYSPIDILEKIYDIEFFINKKSIMNKKVKNQSSQNKKFYKDRKIDIDILFYDQIIIHSSILTIPHSLLHLRKFVLVPMCEILPKKYHPIFNTTLLEILGVCEDKLKIKKIEFE
ncbi:2-amino-4-hydroxy-6-hydroxymethyldihydropteridine diphosphokinase [Blattabacterium punctulatus]|uniref:2-amino-4-hydroxy-6-hydroxymethyldihydropteridine pyrophosphokinase n=1 Tax=Blattabacterium punctulatus TaxID=164514 RepID=A0ABN5M2W2_9FLAO|nr:2-amino-4-hydroxy-6-hydroxymethyldihydropteridine diphosphokinase [Blattabacterium punctulatus]AWU40091.1 2-amino-4-hydroxy-6-hydroxymethyldihydropteridine diphosphokinase [Blattabacterium punctulatus]AWU40633.1 2-amino-4-hydroxy-6-hydroxymethyldihydropteridine diphosphokinase [Blattabacterium punctulatus]AWU43437.1 2-amino-4-hydroxy-6-hydroxymethyldihydropteridine diphosphokinase [Blattabacterium punctulatus]AWU45092.1 2-amino-4-hydroxy-6-hydroxymethyldihydropteridine diphosphokinase [Blatt